MPEQEVPEKSLYEIVPVAVGQFVPVQVAPVMKSVTEAPASIVRGRKNVVILVEVLLTTIGVLHELVAP